MPRQANARRDIRAGGRNPHYALGLCATGTPVSYSENTDHILPIQVAHLDPSGMIDLTDGKMYILQDGYYDISGTGPDLRLTAGDFQAWVFVLLNGVELTKSSIRCLASGGTGDHNTICCAPGKLLAVGDYLELGIRHAHTASVDSTGIQGSGRQSLEVFQTLVLA